MAEFDPATDALAAPSKRRKRNDGTTEYSSPEADERGDHSPPPAKRKPQSLSIRRGRSRTRSRSKSVNSNGDRKEKKRYYSSSRSRSRTPPSRSRSRTPDSRSRSPTRLRSRSPHSEDSRSRSRSRSQSRSRSRCRSSTSSSRARRRRTTPLQSSTPSPSRSHRSTNTPEPLRPQFERCMEFQGHDRGISQVRISPDGRWIASASADGTAKIWDAETGMHMDTLVGHMAGVSCLAWSPDSGTLATGSDDKAIRLWDRTTGNPAHVAGADESMPPGGRIRTSARGIGGRRDGGARGGGGRKPLLGHHNYVYCLAFSPKGNILASGSYDEAVFLWDVRAGRLMRSLPAHSDPVSGIDFCVDGSLVASCSTDGLIRIWDTSTGQCLRTLVYEDNPAVTSVCFSPNGRFVLAFYLDSSVRTWDFISMPSTVKKTYQGHTNKKFSIGGCFGELTSPTDIGDTVAFVTSASEEGDIVMWDVKSKEIVQRIERVHRGVCFWVDVHRETMVSCGQDGRIVVFRHDRGLPAAETDGMDGIENEIDARSIKREDDALGGSMDDEFMDEKQESLSPKKTDVVEE